MKNCGNKIKNTCSEKNYATCIYYELEIPTISSLAGENCVTLEETTEDIYEILQGVLSDISIEALGDDCITYPTVQGQATKIKDVVLKLEEEICNLRAEVDILKTTAICNTDISHCEGLDLSSLDNGCVGGVKTLAQLLDYLLNHTTP